MGRFVVMIGMLTLLALSSPAWDGKAETLADKVMVAMGGKKNYDATRFVSWRFFGKRLHVWDKHTGNLRYESEGLTVLMNVNTQKGKAWQEGQPVTGEAELTKHLEAAYAAWINDSYWVFMPYKLKDPGVNLVYSREDKTEAGADAHVLTMTFESVGLTPENKYEVFIDKASNLVTQWAFFSKASDENPRFTVPWANWQPYGKILLNDDFGKRKHTELAVHEQLPDSVFQSPEPFK